MKNSLRTIGTILSVLLVIGAGSCTDKCADVVCQNNGICEDGICICVDGYSGTNCEIEGPCHSSPCLNGGVCVEGICDCPSGYDGSNCETEISPFSMSISKFTVTNVLGTSWDPAGPDYGADLLLMVGSGSSASNHYNSSSSVSHLNVDSLGEYDFIPADPILISPSQTISLYLFDIDDNGAGDEIMGIIDTLPYEAGENFPESKTLSNSTFTCIIYYSYTW
jgi:hypothetical protein